MAEDAAKIRWHRAYILCRELGWIPASIVVIAISAVVGAWATGTRPGAVFGLGLGVCFAFFSVGLGWKDFKESLDHIAERWNP